jgi:hypothetical protein
MNPVAATCDSSIGRARGGAYSTRPGVYKSSVNPVPDPAGWFHARIEVTKKKVSVFVNEAKEPCLIVDRLASREKE